MALARSAVDDLTRMWTEQPHIIREFLERRPKYEKLCDEVQYILRTRLAEVDLEVSAVTSRAKTLSSFSEKVTRKAYQDPMRDVTDIAGVRIVYLYRDDQETIEALVESEFEILERVDKVETRGVNEFGYDALHLLVRLGKDSAGARYDDLRDLVCEVQVRTVLQDAWAIVEHHLAYKQEGDIPGELQHRLSGLAGLFSTADDQFSAIRSAREQYIAKIRKLSRANFLRQELNLDTLNAFLRWKYPKLEQSSATPLLQRIIRVAQEGGIATLTELNATLERTTAARAAIAKQRKPPSAATQVNRALALVFPKYSHSTAFGPDIRRLITQNRHLVKKA